MNNQSPGYVGARLKHARIPLLVLAVFGVFGATLIFSFFDFDPHHDGYLLAAAIGVHEGNLLFRDVFTQYGPLTTWYQSLWIGLIPAYPAVALRASHLALVFGTALLLGDLGRITSKRYGLSSTLTWTLSLFWLLSNDVFYGVAMLPWSSMLATFMIVAITYLTVLAGNLNSERIVFGSLLMFLAGAILGLLPFARQSVGLIAIGALGFIGLVGFKGNFFSRRMLFSSFLGGVFGNGLVIVSLEITDSLGPWWSQSVLWPLQWLSESDEASPVMSLLQLCGEYALFIIPIGISVWFALTRRGNRILLISIVTVLTLLAVVGFPQFEPASHSPHGFGEALRTTWTSALLSMNIRFLQLVFVGLVFLLAISVLIVAGRALKNGWREIANIRSVFLGLALAALSQTVPISDTRHIWWAMPSLLIAAGSFAMSSTSKTRIVPLATPSVLVWLVSLGLTAGGNLFLVEREPYGSNTLAAGMFGRLGNVERLHAQTEFLTNSAGELRIFLVGDGHLSVIDGTYRSIDAFFVSWGPTPDLSSRVRPGMEIVATSDGIAELSRAEIATKVTSSQDDIELYIVEVLGD